MLTIKNLSFNYKKKRIINNYSYTFNKNCIYVIKASSGKGKTTLLTILANLKTKYKGSIYFNNVNIKKIKDYTFKDVSYVYQDYQLFTNLTVMENITYINTITNTKPNIYQAKRLLEYFEVNELANRKIKNMSGGQKQRIAIIRALLKDSSILLFDEPTSALDERMTNKFIEYLEKIKKDKIIIIVTHNNKLACRANKLVSLEERENILINEVEYYSKNKTKFSLIKLIKSKIFSNKKILKYIASSILTLGLVCISLSFILKDFIHEITSSLLSVFTNSNNITIQANNKIEEVSFKDIDAIYYEGITNKKEIKEKSPITNIELNIYELDNKDFIFDNYLNVESNDVVLQIPVIYREYTQDKNVLHVYYNDTSFNINIDSIIYSDIDNNIYLYSNSISYLNAFIKDVGLNLTTSKYLYSKDSKSLYNKLINDNKYKDYSFTIDNQLISISSEYIPRLVNPLINEFINSNDIKDYILADNIHTYIDFNSGFYYLILDNNNIQQVIIDNTLNDNEIGISSIHANKSFDKKYDIKYVSNENNFDLIYLNSTVYNSFNEKNIYTMLIFNNLDNIVNTNNLLIKKNSYDLSSFDALNYLTKYLLLFSIIIIIIAFISTIVIYSINLIAKRKDIITLYKLGVYKSMISKLLIVEPLLNIFNSIIYSLLAIIVENIFIYYLYNSMNNSSLDIVVNYKLYISITVFPFVIILPFILSKVRRTKY